MFKSKAEQQGALIEEATAKTPPIDGDYVGLMDSTASPVVLKKLAWSVIKSTLKTYFDTLYAAIGGGGTGDVVGPASSTDNAVVRFDGTTGKLVQNSVNTFLSDNGNLGLGTATPRTSLEALCVFAGNSLSPLGYTQLNDAGGISSGDTSVTLVSVSGLPPSGVMIVDNEAITYTSITGSTLNGLGRGKYGTTAASHSDGSYIRAVYFLSGSTDGGVPELSVVGGGLVGINTINFSSAIAGTLSFKIAQSGAIFMGYNGSGWFEMTDGTNTLLWGNNGATGGFFGTYTAHPLSIRIGNAERLNIANTVITAAVDVAVPDEAYGAGWNASLEVPTKNAVYDKVESLALASGTYTPTRSAEANMDSNVTMSEAQYMRVGTTVTVSGRFTADPALTATATSFELTLPIASNIGAVEDVAGVAFCGAIAGMGAAINGAVANDTAKVQWISSDIASQIWSYQFSYQII